MFAKFINTVLGSVAAAGVSLDPTLDNNEDNTAIETTATPRVLRLDIARASAIASVVNGHSSIKAYAISLHNQFGNALWAEGNSDDMKAAINQEKKAMKDAYVMAFTKKHGKAPSNLNKPWSDAMKLAREMFLPSHGARDKKTTEAVLLAQATALYKRCFKEENQSPVVENGVKLLGMLLKDSGVDLAELHEKIDSKGK